MHVPERFNDTGTLIIDPKKAEDGLKRGGMTLRDISIAVRPPDTGRSGIKILDPSPIKSTTSSRKDSNSDLSLSPPDPPFARSSGRRPSRGELNRSPQSDASNSSTESHRRKRSNVPSPTSSAPGSPRKLPSGLNSPRAMKDLSIGIAKLRIRHGEPTPRGDWSSQLDGSVPSQDVRFVAKYVHNLSDITEDMNISGAKSIKRGRIEGMGGDFFIDIDKFKAADLNFYIRIRVTNQCINVRDALKFNPEWIIVEQEFTECFGDTFISGTLALISTPNFSDNILIASAGFIEGGELNALLSIKVLSKNKFSDVETG
ncbi:hypothetical protein ABW19_dt0203070 [Dactylella cylindrospora]|nr:hypothetical protein ABW19_dt0203070 [Dactylella cylindrospora]